MLEGIERTAPAFCHRDEGRTQENEWFVARVWVHMPRVFFVPHPKASFKEIYI